jgi:hypothetical protein
MAPLFSPIWNEPCVVCLGFGKRSEVEAVNLWSSIKHHSPTSSSPSPPPISTQSGAIWYCWNSGAPGL